MPTVCQNFVQNAWKKELCSNCFKLKDEHNQNYMRMMIAPSTISKPIESIIKKKMKSKDQNKKRAVSFTSELSKVIGYGGEDWSDNEVEDEAKDASEGEGDDTEGESEQEKRLRKLTKENTDFNTVTANLLNDSPETKKSYTHLKLGTAQLNSDGKKQTLQVSVTPFGQDKKTPKPSSLIPIAKTKESVLETKNTAVLTSYSIKDDEDQICKKEKSLLEEISETLEQAKSPIQIISRKKTQKDIVLSIPNYNDDKQKSVPEKRNGLTRSPAIKRDDQAKPVIYQTSTARIELLNNRNLKISSAANKIEAKQEVVEIEKEGEKPDNIPNVECVNPHVAYNKNCIIFADDSSSDGKSTDHSHTESDLSEEDSSNEAANSLTESLAAEQEYSIKSESYLETREQAGEPDGHADPDGENEPPPLPTTPPPAFESRSSFLYGITEKPKLPTKPSTVLIRKPQQPTNQVADPQNQNCTLVTFAAEAKASPSEKVKLSKQDSSDSDVGRMSKRRAPMPPQNGEEQNEESIANGKEKPEKVLSCGNIQVENEPLSKICMDHEISLHPTPEPAPRKSLSMSTDSLAISCDDKKKEKSKSRFSLKKFLRINSNKEFTKFPSVSQLNEDFKSYEPLPQPKPRLVIVHPLELNGAKVEVLAKPYQPNDQVDFASYAKPPPPPRNLEASSKVKPNLPHPPKSVEVLNKQKHIDRNGIGNKKKEDSVYANIGEVRSSITPHKPQRTASMREREALAAQQQKNRISTMNYNYEPINICNGKKDNVYEYVNSSQRSSSPECDSSSSYGNNLRGFKQIRSSSHIDVSGEYFKGHNNIPRSASLTYCGSETESEIYSPYSCYGSESEVVDDDQEWNTPNKTHKLRSRKGRSIVHKNLEDNYGAVVVANHEALVQVLENIQNGSLVQPALRGLKTSNSTWSDFTSESSSPLVVGSRIFHQAKWGLHPVTLMIACGPVPSNPQSLGSFNLTPVTEFSDLVPIKFLPSTVVTEDVQQLQATISVFPSLQVHSIQTYGELLKAKSAHMNQEELFREASFVMLQLINALKVLQAQGTEEVPLSLTSFVLCKDAEKDFYYRLHVLQGLGEDITHKDSVKYGSLCLCATTVLSYFSPYIKLTPLLRSLLNTERAVSLTQVKSVLDFSLWGPSDVSLGNNVRERELGLQRWLDLKRATVLHGLVCANVRLTAYEECHLLFLVRSNAKMLCDASLLIDSSNMTVAGNNGKS